jgi:phage tail sheath protein FI
VICDERINSGDNLENGVVFVKVFDTPVPTLERIEVDLIRVSVGQMNRELDSQGLG